MDARTATNSLSTLFCINFNRICSMNSDKYISHVHIDIIHDKISVGIRDVSRMPWLTRVIRESKN